MLAQNLKLFKIELLDTWQWWQRKVVVQALPHVIIIRTRLTFKIHYLKELGSIPKMTEARREFTLEKLQ